jgi:hypothetical protein
MFASEAGAGVPFWGKLLALPSNTKTLAYFACGMYYKHIMILKDDARVVSK